MWYEESVFYQIYPLGFCGAPLQNDGRPAHRIDRVLDWIAHLKEMHVQAVYFGPLWEADAHGYDTRDYTELDCRLGTNADFRRVADALHAQQIRVVLDGVFNHVGRGFWAFQDVLKNRERSRWRDWFYIDFHGDSCYRDGLWYEGWEGHFELVKLNLQNGAVRQYLLECVGRWMDDFAIDGLRLDVAYTLDEQFMRELHSFCMAKNPEFFLLGEMIHGDYNRLMQDGLLHSVTNYECYKGLYSAFNSMNLFEIGHSLQRQFGSDPWCLYRGRPLFSFLDNHDVTRIATILQNPRHLPLAFGLQMAMPGIPCIYYGSEWGMQGDKRQGDAALRPPVEQPVLNDLAASVASYAKARTESRALCFGDFTILHMTNRQLVFRRAVADECVLVLLNIDDAPYSMQLHLDSGVSLLDGSAYNFHETCALAPYSVQYVKTS